MSSNQLWDGIDLNDDWHASHCHAGWDVTSKLLNEEHLQSSLGQSLDSSISFHHFFLAQSYCNIPEIWSSKGKNKESQSDPGVACVPLECEKSPFRSAINFPTNNVKTCKTGSDKHSLTIKSENHGQSLQFSNPVFHDTFVPHTPDVASPYLSDSSTIPMMSDSDDGSDDEFVSSKPLVRMEMDDVLEPREMLKKELNERMLDEPSTSSWEPISSSSLPYSSSANLRSGEKLQSLVADTTKSSSSLVSVTELPTPVGSPNLFKLTTQRRQANIVSPKLLTLEPRDSLNDLHSLTTPPNTPTPEHPPEFFSDSATDDESLLVVPASKSCQLKYSPKRRHADFTSSVSEPQCRLSTLKTVQPTLLMCCISTRDANYSDVDNAAKSDSRKTMGSVRDMDVGSGNLHSSNELNHHVLNEILEDSQLPIFLDDDDEEISNSYASCNRGRNEFDYANRAFNNTASAFPNATPVQAPFSPSLSNVHTAINALSLSSSPQTDLYVEPCISGVASSIFGSYRELLNSQRERKHSMMEEPSQAVSFSDGTTGMDPIQLYEPNASLSPPSRLSTIRRSHHVTPKAVYVPSPLRTRAQKKRTVRKLRRLGIGSDEEFIDVVGL